jgi:hypothetical protein
MLGLADALRIEVLPEQLPWLAEQLDVMRYCLEDELEHQRARRDDEPDDDGGRQADGDRQSSNRLARQLKVLAIVRAQVPLSKEAAELAVASPWDADEPSTPRHRGPEEPVQIVGPAALMTVAICGAMRHAAQRLSEALGHAGLTVHENTDSSRGWRAEERPPRVEPAIAEWLRSTAVAAQAFVHTYLNVLAHQTYSFDAEYDPTDADELGVTAGRGGAPGADGGAGGPVGNS